MVIHVNNKKFIGVHMCNIININIYTMSTCAYNHVYSARAILNSVYVYQCVTFVDRLYIMM